jgi:hypothetical protein
MDFLFRNSHLPVGQSDLRRLERAYDDAPAMLQKESICMSGTFRILRYVC